MSTTAIAWPEETEEDTTGSNLWFKVTLGQLFCVDTVALYPTINEEHRNTYSCTENGCECNSGECNNLVTGECNSGEFNNFVTRVLQLGNVTT